MVTELTETLSSASLLMPSTAWSFTVVASWLLGMLSGSVNISCTLRAHSVSPSGVNFCSSSGSFAPFCSLWPLPASGFSSISGGLSGSSLSKDNLGTSGVGCRCCCCSRIKAHSNAEAS